MGYVCLLRCQISGLVKALTFYLACKVTHQPDMAYMLAKDTRFWVRDKGLYDTWPHRFYGICVHNGSVSQLRNLKPKPPIIQGGTSKPAQPLPLREVLSFLSQSGNKFALCPRETSIFVKQTSQKTQSGTDTVTRCHGRELPLNNISLWE